MEKKFIVLFYLNLFLCKSKNLSNLPKINKYTIIYTLSEKGEKDEKYKRL